MGYRALADAVVLVHFGFIMFVAVGALLAWRWPQLLWAHVPAVAWAAGTVVIGFPCPLTALEKGLRRLAGGGGYQGGFVDRYVEGVVYPERYTVALRVLVAAAVVIGYAGARIRARSSPQRRRPLGGQPHRERTEHAAHEVPLGPHPRRAPGEDDGDPAGGQDDRRVPGHRDRGLDAAQHLSLIHI